MPRARGAAGTVGSWSGCSCANCNKRRSVGLRAEDIDLLAEDIADLLDQGDFRYEDHPEIEPGVESWIFNSNTAAARALVGAVSAGDAEKLTGAWRELAVEDNIEEFYRAETAGQLLILAAQLGKAACIKPLLSLGASLEAVDDHGHQGPALLHAASGGNVAAVRALLEAGASPDQQDVRGQSALIVAVLADRAAVSEVLLSAGADANRADSFGATPIWYCGQFNALDCIPVLGLHGADAFHVDPQTQDDPVEAALKQGYTRAAEALRRLQQRQRMRERQKSGGAASAAQPPPSSEKELAEKQQQADAAMAALLAELEQSSVNGGGGGGKGAAGASGKKKKGARQQHQHHHHHGAAPPSHEQQQQRDDQQQQQQQQPQAQQQQHAQQQRPRPSRQQQQQEEPASPPAVPSPSSNGPLASLIAVLHPRSEAVVLSVAAARSTAADSSKRPRPKRPASANGSSGEAAGERPDSPAQPAQPAPHADALTAAAAAAAEETQQPAKEDPHAELRRQWESLLGEAAACGADTGAQQRFAVAVEQQMQSVAEAGVSVKYGKKLLGKLQRAPAAAAALAAAADAAREVLVPGFDEAMAAAEAAERRANPAAALPDDLFSDEPPAAARQPCAAERRSAAAEGGLEAALAEARSLRAFLQEAALEAGERVLAALQQRRGARQAHQAAAGAAAAVAARAQHLPAALGAGLAGAGQLSQLPLLAAAPAGAAVHDGHDGLTLDNECVICMADIRRVLCVPCGHMCVCARCMPLVQADGACPLCRAPLQDAMQIF
ncbi:hypothetical protein C2E20_3676 [Micractinium conductrix]|uniref:RING-type domain-containing protein n=1 Tax=Micractinium conductrix TaxID=554055 RepID=A0A2P6VGI9_9CHLO|nr:hypothetical protein C2E20_3676 [Micractinium conductrix]|eukprot:PSC73191.1 hypothetical protein C2E20_3676 [Micractinium conductrix]